MRFNVRTTWLCAVLCFRALSYTASSKLCDSFARSCAIQLGDALATNKHEEQLGVVADFISLTGDGDATSQESYYVNFKMPVDIQTVYLDLAIFYGSVNIFAALNREPSASDYDYANIGSIASQPDYLSITSLSHHATDVFHVLIQATSGNHMNVAAAAAVTAHAYFRAVLAYALAPVPVAVDGIPTVLRMGAESSMQLQFSAPGAAAPGSSIPELDLVMSSYGDYWPALSLTRPGQSTPVTSQQHFFANISSAGEGFLRFQPQEQDLVTGTGFFTLQLDATQLAYASVVLRVNGRSGQQQQPVFLLNGLPQSDRLMAHDVHYYVFFVPPDIDNDIIIQLDPYQGDADLFVNTDSQGFYRPQTAEDADADANPPEPATWSSQLPSGQDSVTIKNSDFFYVQGGGAYYITVLGFRDSQYTIRSTSRATASLLVEGYPLQDSVAMDAINYYKFQDTQPTKSVIFDLLPTSGDADLFVSCLFHPTGDTGGYPSSSIGHYNFSSQLYLEDLIEIAPTDPNSCSLGSDGDSSQNRGQGGTFYVAVVGYSDASYTLAVQHYGGEKTLVHGVQTVATVFRDKERRFKLRLGFEISDLSIQLSPRYGDADLYVALGRQPQLYDYDFVSDNYGAENDVVLIKEEDVCASCWVHILVFGYDTTEFSLLATLSDATIVLNNGVPQRGSVSSDAVQYYSYQSLSGDCTVVLVASISSGLEPSLYMSLDSETPSAHTPNTVSRAHDAADGAVPRLELSGVAQGQVVYIGVGGAGSNVTYSIRIHEQNASPPPTLLTLMDGLPQSDSIAEDATSSWLYYQVTAPIGHESILVRMTPIVGNVDMYITRCALGSSYRCSVEALPDASTYDLTTAGDFSKHSLLMSRNDDAATIYVVGVRSLSFYAAYQLSASFENSVLALQAGVAVMDHVNIGEMDYFSYFFDSNSIEALRIVLTPISGDPDVYVSTTIERPSRANHTWESTLYGSDVVSIDPSIDSKACSPCTYYIAVEGISESTYTIAARTSSTLPKLVDGVPTTDSVAQGSWNYYSFTNSHSSLRDLHITLSTSSGNADLYVTLDGRIPSWAIHDYSSANALSSDEIDISTSDEQYNTHCAAHTDRRGRRLLAALTGGRRQQQATHSGMPWIRTLDGVSDCLVLVGVYGQIGSEYSLTLTSSSSAALLQLGVTQTGTVVEGQSKFYRTVVSGDADTSPFTLRFTLTPLSGHVSLYVSCLSEAPNATNYQWAIAPAAVSGSHVDIMSIVAKDQGCMDRSSASTFFASVHGDSAATYSVMTILVGDSSAPRLSLGVAASGHVENRHIDYYFVRPGTSYQDLRLQCTVVQGDVDLYVSSSWDSRPVYQSNSDGEAGGQVVSFQLSSATSGGEDMTISHNWLRDVACLGRGDSCYIIVGVLGVHHSSGDGVPSQYSILASTLDSTTVLLSGVPRQSHVDSQHFEYFKYSLTQPHLDLVIAVTPISGDPDLYVGLKPNYHPNEANFTWHQSQFGADTLTLQYWELAEQGCEPDPARTNGQCDLYIGVYGWENSTFTILASVDEGFKAPISLLDHMPQSGSVPTGQYRYYSYLVNVQDAEDPLSQPPIDIKFMLTPTGGSDDVDLYLLFADDSNPATQREPGKDNYHYKSTGFASVTESIEVSEGMPYFCTSCTAFLAVYGYVGGDYSLQASSSGFVSLQAGTAAGGHVDYMQYSYYSIRNSVQFASLKFTLTMISGDADMYIITSRRAADGSGGSISSSAGGSLPSMYVYTWRSSNSGNDVIEIDSMDENYCSDCDYLVAVFGFSNSTYTLMATDSEESIIKLVPGRPQLAQISSVNKILYFSALITSSVADITIALTALNNGEADFYVQVYNVSTFQSTNTDLLPDPSKPDSYLTSTAGKQDDHVFLPGPHPAESMVVIAVVCLTANVHFNLLVTSSQSPVLLLDSVPQSHYVELQQNVFFMYYPMFDEDLRITLTARSGDPDLFVSSAWPPPVCRSIESEEHGSYIDCANYTWSSRDYMTDQIILSRDFPCRPVIPTTTISPDCDPVTAFDPAQGLPVFIGVFGFSASQFSILASPVGAQVQLLAGKPQLSTTAPSFICADRSPLTGACAESDSSQAKQIQAAYFTFHVSPPSQSQQESKHSTETSERKLQQTAGYSAGYSAGLGAHAMAPLLRSVSDVALTVTPDCPASDSSSISSDGPDRPSAHTVLRTGGGSRSASLLSVSRQVALADCTPGCACAPLQVYVNSCPLSKCTEFDKKPSELAGQHQFSASIEAEYGTTLFLAATSTSAFCDPSAAGETCGYFISVTAPLPPDVAASSGSSLGSSAAFSIIARTPEDVNVIPCSRKPYPDGIKFSASDSISVLDDSSGSTDSTEHHYYELCTDSTDNADTNTGTESLIVELEQCDGETQLYACGDDNHCTTALPTTSSWGYFSDSEQSCVRDWSKQASSSSSSTCSPVPRSDIPSLRLPQLPHVGNYFLMANGRGNFVLNVEKTLRGARISPQLVYAGMHTDDAGVLTLEETTGNTVSLRWHQAQVLLAGLLNPQFADYMSYTAFVVDVRAMDAAAQDSSTRSNSAGKFNFNFNTMCGLAHAADALSSQVVSVVPAAVKPAEEGADWMTHKIQGLSTSTQYRVIVAATCDGSCLRQLSKVSPSPLMSCSASSTDCKTQSLVYKSRDFTTASKSDDNSGDGDSSSSSSGGDSASVNRWISGTIALLVVLLLMVLLAVAYSYKPRDRSLLSLLGLGTSDTAGGSTTFAGIRGSTMSGDGSSRNGGSNSGVSSSNRGWFDWGRKRGDATISSGTEMVESSAFHSGTGLFGGNAGDSRLQQIKRAHPARAKGPAAGVPTGYSRAGQDDDDDGDDLEGSAGVTYLPPPLQASTGSSASSSNYSYLATGATQHNSTFVVTAADDDEDGEELTL